MVRFFGQAFQEAERIGDVEATTRGGDVMSQGRDVRGGSGKGRGRDRLEAMGEMGDRPVLDEAKEDEVRNEGMVKEGLAGNRARKVTIFQPLFDRGTIEGLASAEGNRITHYIK